jgi:hypothetical protein
MDKTCETSSVDLLKCASMSICTDTCIHVCKACADTRVCTPLFRHVGIHLCTYACMCVCMNKHLNRSSEIMSMHYWMCVRAYLCMHEQTREAVVGTCHYLHCVNMCVTRCTCMSPCEMIHFVARDMFTCVFLHVCIYHITYMHMYMLMKCVVHVRKNL